MPAASAPRRLALAVCLALVLAPRPAAAQAPAVGDLAPDAAGVTLAGDSLRLSTLRGRAVLVDFWATWCGPCLAELPRLRALRERHDAADLAVVAVSLDGNRDRLESYVLMERLAWTHIWAPDGFDDAFPERFGVVGLPATFLLDRDGRIVARGLRGAALDAAVDALVAAPAGR